MKPLEQNPNHQLQVKKKRCEECCQRGMQFNFFRLNTSKKNIPDCEMMFTVLVVQKNIHYCGGTDRGCQFLEKEASWIPYSFMGALAAKPGKG